MDLIHHIDVVDQLMSAGCAALSDWSWRKQLRFYTNDQQVVTMVRARVRVKLMVRVTAGVRGRVCARLGFADPPH